MIGEEVIPESENWPCGAGSGECLKPAVFKLPNVADGDDFYVCAEHKRQFDEMTQWLTNHPEKMEPLRKAIAAAE